MAVHRIADVSRWQGRIDWDTLYRSGRIDGVMLRVLGSKNGKPYSDPQFERNYAACARLGLPVGGYYYTCAVTQRQMEEELAALKTALRGKTLQLPLAIDVEDPRLRSLAPAALSALVAQAAARIETDQLRREVSLLKRENENLKSNLELYELRDKVGDNQK